jgi:excisionase family DNA binding protein
MRAYLNASEVAKLLQVDRATVTRWAQQGKLKGAVKIEKSHQ